MNAAVRGRVERFFAWINERHMIHVRRRNGEPWPWTRDRILQTYKFTNVFRELDRETVNFHSQIDELENGPLKLYRMILYRAFNVLATYRALTRKETERSERQIVNILQRRQDAGKQIFTGAYIITNAGQSRPKIELMAEALGVTYRGRERIWNHMMEDGTMRGCTEILVCYPMQGPFTAYEVVCDMRHQPGMLDEAPDRLTWANLGPGARRGINRIVTGSKAKKAFRHNRDYVEFMAALLEDSPQYLGDHVRDEPLPFEMREIEHSLCEFDKYERVRRHEGRPRTRYKPPEQATTD